MQAADYQECGPIMQQRPAGRVRSHHAAMASRTGAVPSCSSGQPDGCEILLFSDFASAFLSFPITGTYDRKNEVREDE